MKYFTIEEFEKSPTASALGIDNAMPSDAAERVNALVANVLDPLREAFGKPIYVNSGYRCAALNKAVGGVANSQHCEGEAADVTTGSRDGNKQLWMLIKKLRLPVDQAINENDYAWLHISHSQSNRGQFFSAKTK